MWSQKLAEADKRYEPSQGEGAKGLGVRQLLEAGHVQALE